MLHNLLGDFRFILASESPRRMEILKQVGIKPEAFPARIDEKSFSGHSDADSIGLDLAEAKVNKVKDLFSNQRVAVLGADTMVIIGNEILGKPRDREEAKKHLEMLSGRIHQVKTALAFFHTDSPAIHLRVETTEVYFKKLEAGDISRYVLTGESLDKAGSYGIQGFASQFIEAVNGCYFNVVGLPIAAFYNLVKGAFHGR